MASSALRAFAESALSIRAGEGRRTALLFAHLLLASAVFTLGRTVRDTLFLSRYTLSALPWMFILYGVASAITAVVYGRIADRVPRHRIIVVSCGIGAATYLATWGVIRSGQDWIYPAFYVWSEVVANLFIVQFWTLANDLHDARSAKRLFGTIGAARVLGVVLVGLFAGAIVKLLGTEQMIFVLTAFMAAIAVLAVRVSRQPRPDSAPTNPGLTLRRERRRRPRSVFGSAYVRALALMILLVFASLTIGDYQFKAIARATYREDELARFFSLFYAGAGLFAFVFQLVATRRILARFGVGVGMSVMPVVFGGASATLLALPQLGVATVMKLADNAFQFTIHETTLQALYVPFAPDVKARTRAILDAVVKPLAYGAGGVILLVAAARLEVGQLAWISVPLVLIWLTLIPVVRRRYLRTLESTLHTGVLHGAPLVVDAGSRRALLRALESNDPRQVLSALELIGTDRSPEISGAVQGLARHPDAAIRAAAIERLANLDAPAALARAACGDPSPSVRRAAATAYAALARDESIDELCGLLDDPDRDVRIAAAAGLMKHGGVEGAISGGEHLGELIASESRDARCEAATILAQLGQGTYRPVRRLLADVEPTVRRAALKSAAAAGDPRLVPMLAEMLLDRHTHRRAGTALVATGRAAIGPLAARLRDEKTPRPVRLEIPRLLRRIAHRDSYYELRRHLDVPDSHLRLRIYGGLSALRSQLELRPEPIPFVQDVVERELAEAYANLAGWEAARAKYGPGSPLLAEVFQFRHDRAIRRILRVLELRYDPGALRLVRERVADPRRRANALEVLDTLLDPALRPVVMPFFDDLPVTERIARAGSLRPPPIEPDEFMRRNARHPNPYVALLALDALARVKDPEAIELAGAALEHPDPLVREGALLALGATALDGARPRVETLTDDPDPIVAAHARAVLGQPNRGESKMYSTLEKVLILRNAALFERVSGEDLAPLARVAEPERYARGETIFREGDHGDSLYLIIRGKITVSRGDQAVATLGAGDTVGEMAVLDAGPRSATAIAAEETEALRIGSEEFYEVLHEQVELAEGVIRVLTQRLRNTTPAATTQERVTMA